MGCWNVASRCGFGAVFVEAPEQVAGRVGAGGQLLVGEAGEELVDAGGRGPVEGGL
jgi:hypothetical protein